MKEFNKILSFIIMFSILTSCLQKQSIEWIPFHWKGDTISGKYIDKAYLYIPVKIEELPYNFTMQLDLGTAETQFYGKSVKPYLEESPSLAKKLSFVQDFKNVIFKNVNLKSGTVNLKFDVWLHEDFGEEIPKASLHSSSPKHIGTIAADIFQNKILIIDYKSCRLAVLDSLPAEYRNLKAEKFELINGMIILPFNINGQVCKLLFDTGSSPFPLATTKKRAVEISNNEITDSLSGPLWWGKEITFYGMEVNKSIKFGEKILKSSKVYYDKEGLWEKSVFTPLNIWGLAGNAYFFDNVVIIDFKNQLIRVE